MSCRSIRWNTSNDSSNGTAASAATDPDRSQSSNRTFRLVIDDVRAFFCAIYFALHEYCKHHGLESFAFGMALNPRTTGVNRADACFNQDTLTRYNFAIGDRAKCVFVLTLDDSTKTHFMLVRDFVKSRDSVNYYKVIRRLATYLLQIVEGFKRASVVDCNGSELHRDGFDYSTLHMSAAAFD